MRSFHPSADRKLLLKYHPDKKATESAVTASNPRFLSIQKAYDTLSDPERKRGYDSQFDFDDSIPSGNETAVFFTVLITQLL